MEVGSGEVVVCMSTEGNQAKVSSVGGSKGLGGDNAVARLWSVFERNVMAEGDNDKVRARLRTAEIGRAHF